MKAKVVTGTGYNQLRWVVLLLTMAVVLPTVCLLWFMNQAVKNERLAVKQKLTDVYKKQLEILGKKVDDLWSAQIDQLQQVSVKSLTPVEVFARFIERDKQTGRPNISDAVIVFDDNGRLIYPVISNVEPITELAEQLDTAWNYEFKQQDYVRAIALYGQAADSLVDDYTRIYALMAQVRCLRKLGDIDKAVNYCRQIAYGPHPDNMSLSAATLIARSRIMLVDLRQKTEEGTTFADVQELMNSAVQYFMDGSREFLLVPSAMRIFLLRRSVEIAEASQWSEQLQPQIQRAKELLSAEELAASFLEKYYTDKFSEQWSQDEVKKLMSSISSVVDSIEVAVNGSEWGWTDQLKKQISDVLRLSGVGDMAASGSTKEPSVTIFDGWPEDSFRSMELKEKVFCMYHSLDGMKYMLLKKAKNFSSDFDLCRDDLEESDIRYRLTDNMNAYACGLENPDKPAFLKMPFGKFFPGWSVEVHFMNTDIFEKAAGKQAIIYIWAALLAIGVIAAAGLLAAQAVGKQIKMNKLKNDFIATVSHELKTPLASMRVLVDTLLEGNYRDQNQVTEYLQLTAQENERLSRLIENFLTFSRMERNKQAFRIVRTSPVDIARGAARAVKTKFDNGRCDFDVSIDENLPDVRADHDAMVTVLINLLENAYKYSYDDKYIRLKVFAENGSVCFSVSDKGIGISRRSIKKIFRRFYQVDRRLARNAEGCGLGLSIAKFIVDSHKGTISINSKLGKGSTFTIRLAAI